MKFITLLEETANILQGASNKIKSNLGVSNIEIEILAAKRLFICSNCSLQSEDSLWCDSKKVEVIKKTDTNYEAINGCGCLLSMKVRSNTNCPLKKW